MATEKRMIDANKAKFFVADVLDIFKIPVGDRMANKLIDTIDALPTIDAVEVVRCKVCRWARPQDHREPVDTPTQALICECFMHHHIPAPWGARLAVNPEHFCSYGERRTDGV